MNVKKKKLSRYSNGVHTKKKQVNIYNEGGTYSIALAVGH